MKQLTLDNIKALKPCQDRLANFISHYPNFKGSIVEFLELDNITYDDKIWVMTRVLEPKILRQWTLACAKSVLHIYEDQYPNDKRPREALEYLETLDLSHITEEQKRKCEELGNRAYSAVRTFNLAGSAAYAAASAYYATSAATTATSAAATHSAASTAAYYYAAYSTDALVDQESQQELNLLFLYDIISQNQ